MIIKDWSWEEEETEGLICLVSNSVYSEFQELVADGAIAAPVEAYRYPDKYKSNLDILCLYLFRDDLNNLEMQGINKSAFFNYLTEVSKGNQIGVDPDKIEIPEWLLNSRSYIELFILAGELCNKISSSSLLGEHPPEKIRVDWWNARQMLTDEISLLRRLALSLGKIYRYADGLLENVESYINMINYTQLPDHDTRLVYMSSYLYSNALLSFERKDFTQTLVLLHRSLEYTLIKVCLEIHIINLRGNHKYYFNNLAAPDQVGKSTNLYNCIKALKASQMLYISSDQSDMVHKLNSSRNYCKLAHGFMAPKPETSEHFIGAVESLTTSLLGDARMWQQLVDGFSFIPKFSLSEMFMLEENIYDYVIKIKS